MTDFVIRPATAADSDVILRWRNIESDFRHYRSDGPVTAIEHAAWFSGRVASWGFWLAEQDSVPAGSVRVDVDGESGIVSIVVDPDHRGRGVGSRLLEWAAREARDQGLTRLVAEIHPANVASISLFERCGYGRTGGDGAFLRYEFTI